MASGTQVPSIFFLATHVPKTAAPAPVLSLCSGQEEETAKGAKGNG